MDRDTWKLEYDLFIFGCVRFPTKHQFCKEENVQINPCVNVNV